MTREQANKVEKIVKVITNEIELNGELTAKEFEYNFRILKEALKYLFNDNSITDIYRDCLIELRDELEIIIDNLTKKVDVKVLKGEKDMSIKNYLETLNSVDRIDIMQKIIEALNLENMKTIDERIDVLYKFINNGTKIDLEVIL